MPGVVTTRNSSGKQPAGVNRRRISNISRLLISIGDFDVWNMSHQACIFLSVTEAPLNINFLRVSEEETLKTLRSP